MHLFWNASSKMKCKFESFPGLPCENSTFLIKQLFYLLISFSFWSALIMINTRHKLIASLFWHVPQIACTLHVGSKNNQSSPGNISLCRCSWKVGWEALSSSDNSAAPCQGAGAEEAWCLHLAKLLSWISNTADVPAFVGFQGFGGLLGHWSPVLDGDQLFLSRPGQ